MLQPAGNDNYMKDAMTENIRKLLAFDEENQRATLASLSNFSKREVCVDAETSSHTFSTSTTKKPTSKGSGGSSTNSGEDASGEGSNDELPPCSGAKADLEPRYIPCPGEVEVNTAARTRFPPQPPPGLGGDHDAVQFPRSSQQFQNQKHAFGGARAGHGAVHGSQTTGHTTNPKMRRQLAHVHDKFENHMKLQAPVQDTTAFHAGQAASGRPTATSVAVALMLVQKQREQQQQQQQLLSKQQGFAHNGSYSGYPVGPHQMDVYPAGMCSGYPGGYPADYSGSDPAGYAQGFPANSYPGAYGAGNPASGFYEAGLWDHADAYYGADFGAYAQAAGGDMYAQAYAGPPQHAAQFFTDSGCAPRRLAADAPDGSGRGSRSTTSTVSRNGKASMSTDRTDGDSESQTTKSDSSGEATLRVHLQELQGVPTDRILLVRNISKLGFKSAAIIEKYFSKYGEVERVLVAHSCVKPLRTAMGSEAPVSRRLRPSGLGFVVMTNATSATSVLADGEGHAVGGLNVCVRPFQRRLAKNDAQSDNDDAGSS